MRSIPALATAGLLLIGGTGLRPAAAQVTSGEQPAPPPMMSMQGGRPTLTLGGGNLTIQPVLRLDLDAGGFFDQTEYPGGRPPIFMDRSRPGVPSIGGNWRRARVGLQGKYLKDFTYSFVWELAPGVGAQFQPVENSRLFELQTAYTGFGWITPRIGAYTLMHTIEFSMSSFELLFMERPSIITVATGFASGDARLAVGGEAHGDRWFASAYFADGTTTSLNDDRERGLAGRAAGLAFNESWLKLVGGINGAAQFHPGTNPGPQAVRLRDRPELRIDPTRLLDTRSIRAGSVYALGPEVSGLIGPLYVQSEYQWIRVDANNNRPDNDFWGYYVSAALPLWGEPRRYDKRRAAFSRPRFEELNPNAGTWGWAEIAARWSYITLNDGPVRGGSQGIFTVGLNYYPLRRVRATVQYSNGTVRLDGPDRAFQSVAARLSFNW